VTRRPARGGPVSSSRTWTVYFGGRLPRQLPMMGSDYRWDVNFVDSANKANQTFPAVTTSPRSESPWETRHLPPRFQVRAARPVRRPGPADHRRVAQVHLAPQVDSSEQISKVFSATSRPSIKHQDRPVGIAIGAEHRIYDGSQSRPAAADRPNRRTRLPPCSAGYHVERAYARLAYPCCRPWRQRRGPLFGLFPTLVHDHL